VLLSTSLHVFVCVHWKVTFCYMKLSNSFKIAYSFQVPKASFSESYSVNLKILSNLNWSTFIVTHPNKIQRSTTRLKKIRLILLDRPKSHEQWRRVLRPSYDYMGSNSTPKSNPKRKLVFQPSIFRCYVFFSWRIYIYIYLIPPNNEELRH